MAHTSGFVGNTNDIYKQEFAGTFSTFHNTCNSLDSMKSGSCIKDTGATTHMCTDLNQFSNILPTSSPISVNLPDGSIRHVTQIRDVKLAPNLILKETIYTPCFRFNLLSINKLSQHAQIKFFFLPNLCLLQDLKTDKVLAKGRMMSGLYVLDNFSVTKNNNDRVACNDSMNSIGHDTVCNEPVIVSKEKHETVCNDLTGNTTNNNLIFENKYDVTDMHNSLNSNTLHLCVWHMRLAHASHTVLQHIKSPDVRIPSTDKSQLQACEVCHKAKQTRLPFPVRTSTSSAKFELIHMDVWGPYSEHSLANTNYMLTLVDDFSRATWTYLLQHKSQATATFSTFINMVHNQFDGKIKGVKTDNGKEFVNYDFLALLNKHCIIHQKTCPYTPQQNGTVERKHRHLLQLARSLMIQANLPKWFWSYSLLTATYIINRLPSPILNWKTPYETLHGKQPNYSNLRVFGCLSYATNVGPHKGKFEPRAQKCIFIGFSPGKKAYKLYSLDSEQVIISKDVFYENLFPFQFNRDDQQQNSLPLPVTFEMESALIYYDDIEENHLPITGDYANPYMKGTGAMEANAPHRHSTRQWRAPRRLNDFVTNSATTKETHTTKNLLTVTKPTAYTPNTFPYNLIMLMSTFLLTYLQF